MEKINFYSVIIGTELLNGRRRDSHFDFVNKELIKRDWEQKANFVIDDDPKFMESVYELVKKDERSAMFSFGGIGSTPDDYTREVSARVFTGEEPETHQKALNIIESNFRRRFQGDAEYKLSQSGRLMAVLPKGSDLIENPYNGVPGYSLESRFFFVPGFPQMAHPMVENILDTYFPKGEKKIRKTVRIYAGEGVLIDIMKAVPKVVEISSLPSVNKETTLSLASCDKEELEKWFKFCLDSLEEMDISYGFEGQ